MTQQDCEFCTTEGVCTKMTSTKERKFPQKPYYCGVDNPSDCELYKERE